MKLINTPHTRRKSAKSASESGLSEQEKSCENISIARKLPGSGFPRMHVRHWETKVTLEDSTEYGVRILFKGKRHRFALKTANKEAAARKACDIYKSLVAKGWDATLSEQKPGTVKPAKGANVGDLIRAYTELARVRPATLAENVSAFRRIASDVAGIPREASRYATRGQGEGRAAWIAATDSVPLASLTAAKLAEWMNSYVRTNGTDELSRRAAQNSANCAVRMARSLLAKKLVRFYEDRLALPSPLPFAGVAFFKRQSARYVSSIDAGAIVKAAIEELATDAEALKAFVLLLCGGLRKNEADKLRWASIDFAAGVIRIQAQHDFAAKNEDSLSVVPLEAEACSIFQGLRAKQPDAEYVLEGVALKRVNASFRQYRAIATFNRLMAWLRAKGVADLKPLHAMRKEAGSLVCKEGGLLAASRFLRHADIAITAQHYVEQRNRVTVGLGALLAPVGKVIEGDFTGGVDAAKSKKRRAIG